MTALNSVELPLLNMVFDSVLFPPNIELSDDLVTVLNRDDPVVAVLSFGGGPAGVVDAGKLNVFAGVDIPPAAGVPKTEALVV